MRPMTRHTLPQDAKPSGRGCWIVSGAGNNRTRKYYHGELGSASILLQKAAPKRTTERLRFPSERNELDVTNRSVSQPVSGWSLNPGNDRHSPSKRIRICLGVVRPTGQPSPGGEHQGSSSVDFQPIWCHSGNEPHGCGAPKSN